VKQVLEKSKLPVVGIRRMYVLKVSGKAEQVRLGV